MIQKQECRQNQKGAHTEPWHRLRRLLVAHKADYCQDLVRQSESAEVQDVDTA